MDEEEIDTTETPVDQGEIDWHADAKYYTEDEIQGIIEKYNLKPNPMDWYPGANKDYVTKNEYSWLRGLGIPYRTSNGRWYNIDKFVEKQERIENLDFEEEGFYTPGGTPAVQPGENQRTMTPEKQKEFDYYNEVKSQEESSGEMFVPTSWKEVAIAPDVIETLEDTEAIEKYKKEWFRDLVFNPYIETSEGSGEYVLFTQMESWRRNEDVPTYTFEEKFEKQKEIVAKLKDTEGWNEYTQKSYVEKFGEGYQVFIGTGEDRDALLDEPMSKELAEEQSARYNASVDSAMLLTDPNTTLESFIENSEDLDAQLLAQKEMEKVAVENQIVKFFANNYIEVDKDTLDQLITDVVDGNISLDNVEKEYRDKLILEYPALEEKLLQGQTIKSVADFYVEKMANLLEISPDDVNLSDPYIQKALSNKNEKGDYELMTVYDFESEIIRNDPRYGQTSAAKNEMLELSRYIAQDFGLA